MDHGVHGIWVWVGKKASDKERTEALRNARGFVKKKKYPNNTKVTRVVEGAEPLEFKVLFLKWKNTAENGRCFSTKTQSGTYAFTRKPQHNITANFRYKGCKNCANKIRRDLYER